MTTSLQRTYRYLRIGLAAMVPVILIAVAITAVSDGGVLGSISAYFYTPARTVVTGALIAAAVALLALSGRGLERVLLDAAGMLAPLVAVVPTPLRDQIGCPEPPGCVPAMYLADIRTGVLTYLIAGGVAWLVVAALVVARRIAFRPAAASLAIFLGLWLAILLSWVLAPAAFVGYAHVVAAALFFGLIGVVAILNARPGPHPAPARWVRNVYGVVAVGMVVDVLISAVQIVRENGAPPADRVPLPPLFAGEVIALLLFLTFWVVQSVQKWRDADPSLL